MTPPPRTRKQRKHDALHRLEQDIDAVKTGFDPRRLSSPYLYFRIHPQRAQAWREADELAGRDLMRDGQWLGDDG